MNCNTCKYEEFEPEEYPCLLCVKYSKWEKEKEQMKEEREWITQQINSLKTGDKVFLNLENRSMTVTGVGTNFVLLTKGITYCILSKNHFLFGIIT